MRLIDAHCHFDFPRFDGCRDSELDRARESGLVGLVIPGVRRADWDRVRETALAYPETFYCLGIHPWYVAEHDDSDLQLLERLIRQRPERCVAIGECGLDRVHGDLDAQWPWFEAQVGLAMREQFPLVVHSVRTHDEVHGILNRANWEGPALVHGFSGSYQQACKLVDLGCCIGIGGVITHVSARKTREAVAKLPLSALVLETDAPDMAPSGVEKGRNSPANVGLVLRVLAELRGVSPEALAPVLLENARRLYRLEQGV
ncbi:TatD family hydrolase [Marinobacter sp. M216]|uniref:TatD family hydrolase n=1 Tax=Marinobacter albus TaxID=3030833 RepID=A0ABT7HGH9_9GAMM|nr:MULTISPECIES: TatD family hydrolase [unclassified Marinobacter]MBW7472933.1 TatD family hydrolase [Marinobacter sp. F4218]MDK9559485.1 TatD family hydrolase [Marinobacter sp. M216]